MGGSRSALAVCLVVSLTVLALPVCCAAQSQSQDVAAAQVAEAPASDATPTSTEEGDAAASESAVPDAGAAAATQSPKAEPSATEVAALTQPPAPTAADLLDKALEYGFYKHWAERRAYLEEAADAAPGSKDSCRALVLLAETYSHEGDQVTADALFGQALNECPDSETAAFAHLVHDLFPLYRADDYEAAKQLLRDTASTWHGTYTGGWAQLRLAEIHSHKFDEYEAAIAEYQVAIEDYPDTWVSDEARLGIAEAVGWSGDHAGAAPLLEEVAYGGASECQRLRAKVSLADCLVTLGEHLEGYRLACDIIEQYPQRPVVGFARVIRADAARQLGLLDQAAADAEAYLSWPAREALWTSYAHYILGQHAYRGGGVEEAEVHFTAAVNLPEDTPFTGRAYAGIAECRRELGDLTGALAAMLEAADHTTDAGEECTYLYRAVLLAEKGGDAVTSSQVLGRMMNEFPGSRLTRRLVGYDLLPVPEI